MHVRKQANGTNIQNHPTIQQQSLHAKDQKYNKKSRKNSGDFFSPKSDVFYFFLHAETKQN